MVIAIGTGWPARRLRTMMSSASGNCAPNFFCRRPRLNLQHQQRQQRAAEQRGAERLQQVAAGHHDEAEREQRQHDDVDRELDDAELQARLQDQPVERDQRQPVVAGRW